jgi:hypothetical protein
MESLLTNRLWAIIAHWNRQTNNDVIRSSFNLDHYLKVKKYRNGIKKN